MMKTIRLIIAIAIGLTTTSCKQLILKMAGFEKPKVENRKSVMEFLRKCHTDTNNVYCMDTNFINRLSHSSFKPGWKPGFRPIQIKVFDKERTPIMKWTTCEGPLNQLHLFDSVPLKTMSELSSDLDLQSDLDQYFTLEGKPADIRVEQGYDYYFIVYYATWMKSLSKSTFTHVNKFISSHPELKILVYKIDVDCQEFWGVDCKTNYEIH
jgi:hypothetical protein